jgi:starch phosphorylase
VDGLENPHWCAHDLPIAGYGGQTVNSLRLYLVRASSEFDMQIFNAGDYLKAVEQKRTIQQSARDIWQIVSILDGSNAR